MVVDELQEIGLESMTDEEIRGFLSSQKMGVLGLPSSGSPYLLPMSYGFDGESTLYFTYIAGPDSRKRTLSEQAERGSFLLYAVDSMFSWESVLLDGTIEEVPETEWDELDAVTAKTWRPELLSQAVGSGEVAIFAFRITERSGIKHTGLPPRFRTSE